MNLKKLGAVIGAAALLAAGAVVGIATPASAHTPSVTATCSQLSVNLEDYASSTSKHNTVTVTVNGKTVESANFESSFTYTWANTDQSTNYSYKVVVDAFDNNKYDFSTRGTTTTCVAAPQVTCTSATQHQSDVVYDAIVTYVDRVTGKSDSLTVYSLNNKKYDWSSSKAYPLPQSYSITEVRFKTLAGNDVVWTGTVTCGVAPIPVPTITNADATCSLPGLAVVHGADNATFPALNTQPGSYQVTFTAASGYVFNVNGQPSATATVTYSVLDKKPADSQECVRQQYPYVTVVWQMPTKPADAHTATWSPHQTFISSTAETTTTGALDVVVPTTCSTYYQVDVYNNNDTTASLIAGGVLNGPGNPSESLIPGGEGTAWKFVLNPDCKQVTVPEVSWTDNVCGSGTSNATLTLPSIEGVIWHVNNPATDQAPGEYPMSAGGPNVITATAAPGYVLAKPFEQDVTFGPVKTNQSTNPQGECYVPPTIQACTNQQPGILSTNLDVNDWDFGESRTAGHNTYVANGLHVYTDDNTSEAKAAGYHAVSMPLTDVGSPSIDLANVSGVAPGLQLGIDRDGDGTWDGYLVNEGDTYGAGMWWTNKTGFGVTAGGGYPSLGTLQQYLAANPNAKVVSVGYSLGSGVKGSATIKSITVGCQTFTFDYKTQLGALASETVAAQPTCHADATPSYTLTNADWVGDAVQNKDGSWSRTAKALGDYVFDNGETTETITFSLAGRDLSLCEKPTLQGSVVTGKCVANAPWIYYTIVVDNPDNVALTDHDIVFSMDSGSNHWDKTLKDAIPTTTEGDDAKVSQVTVAGRILWPGADVASDGVTATAWPGWVKNSDGSYSENLSENFGWTRDVSSLKVTVNPELTASISYPPATPSCNAAPPAAGDDASGLASTGSNILFPLIAGGAIVVLGGIALAFRMIRRRRTAGEQ